MLLSFPFSIIVFFIILKQIKSHNNNILNWFSSIENKELNWLRLIVIINIGFIVFWLIDDSVILIIGDNLISETIALLSLYATLLNVVWMGFASLRQPIIYDKYPENQIIDPTTDNESEVELNPKDQTLFSEIINKIESEIQTQRCGENTL